MAGCYIVIALLVLIIAIGAYQEHCKRVAYRARIRALTIADVDNMDGSTFEHYIALLLMCEGYTQIEVTKGSGDMGVDILASKDCLRYAIQVKRYSGKVPRQAVSDAVGGKDYYSCNAAMVVTNSHLTEKSVEFAQRVGCKVIDREILADWIIRFQQQGSKADHQPSRKVIPKQFHSTENDDNEDENKANCQAEQYQPLDIPNEVLCMIKENAMQEWQDDFVMQRHTISEEVRAYRTLATLSIHDVPDKIFSVVKNSASREWPENFNMQLHTIEEEVGAYRALAKLSVDDVPARTMTAIRYRATKEWPENFSMQLATINEQIEAYREFGHIE